MGSIRKIDCPGVKSGLATEILEVYLARGQMMNTGYQ